MKYKAIVYDTQNGEPMETTVRCIFCDKNGKPIRLQAHNGINYNEFKLECGKPLSNEAQDVIKWMYGNVANRLTVNECYEIVRKIWGQNVIDEIKQHVK